MHEKAKRVCFIYMPSQKVKFKSVQINMKQVSYSCSSVGGPCPENIVCSLCWLNIFRGTSDLNLLWKHVL